MKEVKKATNLADGVKNLIAAANEDYVDRTNYDGLSYDEQSDSQKVSTNKFNEEFINGWTVKEGPKYIKLIKKLHMKESVWGFVVKGDNDKLFKKGDLLKPAGWNAPARNAPRGNVLEGGFPVNWTGPLYLN